MHGLMFDISKNSGEGLGEPLSRISSPEPEPPQTPRRPIQHFAVGLGFELEILVSSLSKAYYVSVLLNISKKNPYFQTMYG